jgi:hypothetical protein
MTETTRETIISALESYAQFREGLALTSFTMGNNKLSAEHFVEVHKAHKALEEISQLVTTNSGSVHNN